MKSSQTIFIAIGLLVFSMCQECELLRCRTDDGPSEDELKRIARTCMKRVGENDTNSDNDNYDDSDEDSFDTNSKSDNNKYYLNNRENNNNNRQGNYNYQSYDRGQSYGNQMIRPNGQSRDQYDQNGVTNGYQNWNNQNNNWHNNNQSYQGQGQYDQNFGNNNNNNNNNNKNSKNNNNQTERDRACLVHCFFHELKLTNNEDFPDKRRMINILTGNIRDRELKEFFNDSIQECFHMIDHLESYRRQKDKCDMAQTLVTCLTERAKANCEDFTNDSMIL